jgi:glucose/arabinose dehydrogenase
LIYFINKNKIIKNLQYIILSYKNQTKITMIILSLILNLSIILNLALGTNLNDSFAQSDLDPDQQMITDKQMFLGSTASTNASNAPRTDIFNITSSYIMEPIIWNLTAPTSITFDNKGNMYITQAGYPFTKIPEVPKILKVNKESENISIFVEGKLNAPVVDIEYNNKTDQFFVAHRDKISTIDMNGTINDIIVGLPANGDHHVNQIDFSADGKKIFFGIGSATNSGVVGGEDHVNLEWLKNLPMIHEIPGNNITLTGQNFVTQNPLTAEPNDTATTGAFVPFGTSTKERQIIKGNIKCNGCVLSANLDGTDLKLVGWGFRNPSGLAFNDEGRLFVTMHGADERGSRPIANDTDKFYEILLNETAFYGWPDFFGNGEPVTDPKFQSERSNKSLQFLIQDHPPVRKPLTFFQPPHTSAIQIDFADESFGFTGEAFVAQMGTFAPGTGPVPSPDQIVGQDIVRVNVNNGTVSKFITLNEQTISFRPVGIQFHKDQQIGSIDENTKQEVKNGNFTKNALYIVDWGDLIFPMGKTIPNTGVIWKVISKN